MPTAIARQWPHQARSQGLNLGGVIGLLRVRGGCGAAPGGLFGGDCVSMTRCSGRISGCFFFIGVVPELLLGEHSRVQEVERVQQRSVGSLETYSWVFVHGHMWGKLLLPVLLLAEPPMMGAAGPDRRGAARALEPDDEDGQPQAPVAQAGRAGLASVAAAARVAPVPPELYTLVSLSFVQSVVSVMLHHPGDGLLMVVISDDSH